MTLEDLIKKLEQYPRDKYVSKGFCNPSMSEADFTALAFEPCEDTTVGAMLDCAKEVINKNYYDYKSDKERTHDEYSECWLEYDFEWMSHNPDADHSLYGCRETIGETLLGYMLGDY
tara:strand:+ start:3168 stop:3518 length:351 start_codon:yes stop_codon:yes gene_type:complete